MSGFFGEDDETPNRPYEDSRGNNQSGGGSSHYNSGNSNSYNNGQSGGNNYGQNRSGGSGGGYNKGGNNNGQSGGKKFERKPEEPGFIYLPYVVTGDKNVPPAVVEKIAKYIRKLNDMGYSMRTGGHTEFENEIEGFGSKDKTEVYIPFKDFNERQTKYMYCGTFVKDVAGMFHASWAEAKGQSFYAKNVKMLAGTNGKSRAMFAIVWTEDGVERAEEIMTRHGQLGHFIKVACGYRIPVFNFGRPDAEERLQRFLTTNP